MSVGDSTSQERLAEELEKQRQYFASLLDVSPVAIVTTDLDAKVTSWNPAAEALFGYRADEAVGRVIDDLIANRPDLRHESEAFKEETSRTGRFHGITRRARKDGGLVDVDIRAVTVHADGEAVGYYAIYHDISELQRQKQYYEGLLETSPAAIMTVDVAGTVTSWNPAAERLLGYSRDEALGRNIDELVANRDELRAEADEVSRRAYRGEQVHLVTKRTRKDGSLVDVDVVASSISVGGEMVGFYTIYSDVTELQRQRLYYSSLVDLSPTAIATVDRDDVVTSWNPAAEQLFGYTRDEAIGRNIDDLVANDEELHEEAVGVSRRATEGPVRLVTRRTRRDGSLVDVDVRTAPLIVDGERIGLFALYHDITELQRQRRFYEALVESSPIAIALLDRSGIVTSWNPTAERLFGYTPAEAVGRHIDDLVATSDELREEAARYTAIGMLEGDFAHAITRRTRKDGALVDVELFGAPVMVGGEAAGLYAMYHDVGELQRARREAEAATEAKSAFLATMSHEIRTPMNAVIGMTDLLLRTELDAEQRSFAEVIRTSGEALLSVINDILDFSKIEAGRLGLDRQPFDLRESVESALELVARDAAEKGLDLAYRLRPGTPEALVGDASRLRQILLNLLNNAVKFTEEGEVVLTVEAEPLDPDESKGRSRHRVHFAVADTGIGIAEERLPTLFESFSQVDASTTRRYGGTGLGLAISRRLSELMRGAMWVESRPGEGSTFHFTIEADAAPHPERPYERAGDVPLAGRRILILDDNATNREILRWQTAAWGMTARDTGSPSEALEWIRLGDPFDLAILDMQMPDMDGAAVAREVRALRDADRLPLILLTSLGWRDDEAEEGVFAARLTKPIRPSQLYDVLLRVLGAGAPPAVAEEARRVAPEAEALPLRILVAEDNPVNRQLALLLLQKMGYDADVVVNGAEAVEAVERDGYDVVLMDVQMPEMDGLEATRTIHERLAERRPHIIAATANAMEDERQRCLAAGMDDYLSKPIRMEELAAALGRAGGIAGPPPAGVLEADALERLRATLGEDGTRQLVDSFVAEAPKLISALRSALDHGDAEGLRRAAHTLKSNAATFGATALSETSAALERIGANHALDGAAELIARAEREYEQTRSTLEASRESGAP
jgi:PAS domain S-box-containing protein